MHFATISLVVTAAAAVAAALADGCVDATSEETSLVQRLHKGGKARSNATSKMNDIPGYCALMREACSTIFSEAVDSEEDCQLDTAEADGVCEAVGAGPEDPFADACAVAFTTTIEIGCTKAVKAGQSFGSQQCDDVVGCGCKADSVADGGKCTAGMDTCCENGAACGRYETKDNKFQCCSNYAVVDGVAWCQNGAGGACSDGDNDNCASGTVCGRFSSNEKAYQCCAAYQEVGGVAWCANSQGSDCSDGENNNCVFGLACGRWGGSASGYACCSDYTTSSKGITSCTSV
eukprot:gb/GFBE01020809.1/.p1 GENE.gb/GFBE01020809.1/~~gb/GFBE01020809.1/.p1  ORF type:complete len:290 (+),score=48.16 gb/GFBE01020809.1/:1-870(+)